MQKEQFKNFGKKLFVYLLAKKPTMDFSEVKKQKLAYAGELTSKIGSKEFDDHKGDAEEKIKQIDLDSNESVQTFAEKEHIKNLMKHNDLQFQNLETQYRRVVKQLGSRSEKLSETRELLDNAVDKYMDEIDRYVMQLTLNEGNIEAKAAVIDRFISELGSEYAGLEGLGMYLIKGNKSEFSQLRSKFGRAKTKKDVYEVIKGFINTDSYTDSKALENAVDAMVKDLPQFAITRGEKVYFQTKFKESEKGKDEDWLGYSFGKGNEDTAYKILGTRFHVEFEKNPKGETTKKPEYIYDLLDNQIYKPGAEWDSRLKEVCQDELAGEDAIEDQMEQLEERKEERDDKIKELKEGPWYSKLINHLGNDEATGLGGLKDNDTFSGLLGMTKEHLTIINRGIDPKLKEIKALSGKVTEAKTATAMRGLSDSLTPETIRKSGLLGLLAQLFKAIHAAIKSNDHEALGSIVSDIADGKGLDEIKEGLDQRKDKVRKNYEKLLTKSHTPKLPELFDLYKDPKKLEKFYEERSSDDGESKQMIKMYPKLQREVIVSHLESKLGIKDLTVVIDGGVIKLGFLSRNTKNAAIFEITKPANGTNKMKVQIKGGKTQEKPHFSIAALKQVVDGFEAEQKSEAATENAALKKDLKILDEALEDLSQENYDSFIKFAEKYIPPKDMPKPKGDTEMDKKFYMNTFIRAKFEDMAKTDPNFLAKLKADPILKSKFEVQDNKEEVEFAAKAKLYDKALYYMIGMGDPDKSSSPLKAMLKLTDIPADKYPKWGDFSKIRNKTDRQDAIDEARYEAIKGNMGEKIKASRLNGIRPFIEKLDKSPIFQKVLEQYNKQEEVVAPS